jgi:hypothetical protein
MGGAGWCALGGSAMHKVSVDENQHPDTPAQPRDSPQPIMAALAVDQKFRSLWHRPGASGVAVVQARPETPGAVATPLATLRSRGGPEGGADGIDRSIRVTESLLDRLGLLGSGYLGVPARVVPSASPSPGWKEVACPTSGDPPAPAGLDRDRRPRDPAGPAAGYGPARPAPHRQGRRLPPVDDLPPRRVTRLIIACRPQHQPKGQRVVMVAETGKEPTR